MSNFCYEEGVHIISLLTNSDSMVIEFCYKMIFLIRLKNFESVYLCSLLSLVESPQSKTSNATSPTNSYSMATITKSSLARKGLQQLLLRWRIGLDGQNLVEMGMYQVGVACIHHH